MKTERTIRANIARLKDAIKEEGVDPDAVLKYSNITDNRGLIVFALRFLKNNILDALIEPYWDDLTEKEAGDGEYL